MSLVAGSVERPPAVAGDRVTCRACDADDAAPVIRSGDRLLGIAGEFQVVRCRRCGFLYTNPQPDDATLARHYPPSYPAFRAAATARLEDGSFLRRRLRTGVLAARGYPLDGPAPGRIWRAAGRLAARLVRQRFLWLPPYVPAGILLEVGSATGAYLAEMRDLGWSVMGVEADPGAAAAARDRHGLDVRTGSLEEADLPDASADVVVMRMVLEHVRDPRRTLAHVRRILKPGGLLLLSVPNAGSLEARGFGRHWYAWDLPRHLSHFTTRTVIGMLREAGFAGIRLSHLVSANNLAASLHYRRGGLGSPDRPRLALRILSVVAAAMRTSGRIAVEAERPEGAEEIRGHYARRAGADAQSSTLLTQRAVSRMLEAISPITGLALDLGCGLGSNLPAIRRVAGQVVGLDISLAALKRAALGTDQRVSLVAADAGRVPLLSESVAVVVCSEVLEHVPDLPGVLSEVGRVLEPGGWLLLTTPNYLNPMGLRKRRMDRLLGAPRWEPWGAHGGGMERLVTRRTLERALPPEFEVIERFGLDLYTAWFAPSRLMAWFANRPLVHALLDERLGRLPCFRSTGMHYCLVARKRA